MANNYYDMTGVLILDKVTPVIKALFGAFDLDEKYPGNGLAYIADISETTCCSWGSVLDEVKELVKALGLHVSEDQADGMEAHLEVLSTHFGTDDNEELHNLIERQSFEDGADLCALFVIAQAFNDGHGLKAFKTESSWHCSRPRLFEFGGFGEFTGSNVTVTGSSSDVVSLGENLEATLSAGNTDGAAKLIGKTVASLLAGIYDEAARFAVRLGVSSLLSEQKMEYTDVLKHAQTLAPDDGDQNPEYLRGMAELMASCFNPKGLDTGALAAKITQEILGSAVDGAYSHNAKMIVAQRGVDCETTGLKGD